MTVTVEQFKVDRTDREVYYQTMPVTTDEAESVGCPGATHKLTGSHGTTYGVVIPVTGRERRIPAWSTRRGMLAVFTPWGNEHGGDADLRGFLTTDGIGTQRWAI